MLYIFLAALFSLIIAIVFKMFERYDINANQAIVVNYISCVITGCISTQTFPFEIEMLQADWMPLMLFLGFVFMGGFNLVSLTIQHFGIAVSTVAQRMSLGFSGGFAIWYYQEAYSFYRIAGILVALSAVIFINFPTQREPTAKRARARWMALLPVIIFLISGTIEISLQYLHAVHQMLPSEESIILFASAAIVGLVGLSIQVIFFRQQLAFRNLVAGIILGVPNYFSIYYMLCALEELDGSIVYALSNILIVAGAALVGYFVFKERLSLLNAFGIALALLSIFLITK